MKKLFIVFLFFTILNSFSNVFASSEFDKIFSMPNSTPKEKANLIKLKILATCNENTNSELDNSLNEEVENTIMQNRYDEEFCQEVNIILDSIDNKYGQEDYILKSGDDRSEDRSARFSYRIL